MAPSLILKRGNTQINLNQSPCYLQNSFSPPITNFSYQVTDESEFRRYEGASLVTAIAKNKTIEIPISIQSAGKPIIKEVIRTIQTIIQGSYEMGEHAYLIFRETDEFPSPIVSSVGGNVNFEIVTGNVDVVEEYSGSLATYCADISIVLNVKPFAEGDIQSSWNGTGCTMSFHPVKLSNGRYQGMYLMSGENYIVNPTFEDGLTGWNFDTNLDYEYTYEEADVIFSWRSLHLWGKQTSTDELKCYRTMTFTNLASVCVSAFVKAVDGATIDANLIKIYYNTGEVTTTYKSIGEGWFKIYGVVTGTGTAVSVGIILKRNANLILAGMTAYLDSASERALESMIHRRLPQVYLNSGKPTTFGSYSGLGMNLITSRKMKMFDASIGSIIITFKANLPPSGIPSDYRLIDLGGTLSAGIYITATTGQVKFAVTGGSVTSSAIGWSAGDILQLAICFDDTGIKIYNSGVEIGSGTVPTFGAAYLVLQNSVSLPGFWMLLKGVSVFDEKLTLSQVQAFYNYTKPILDTGAMIEPIPFVYGSDNTNMSLNIRGANGITGDAPTKLIAEIGNSGGIDIKINCLRFACVSPKTFICSTEFQQDVGDTADASAIGGYAWVQSIGTTPVTIPSSSQPYGFVIPEPMAELLTEREFYINIRLKDAGSNLMLAPAIVIVRNTATPTTDYQIIGEYQAIVADTTYRSFTIGPIRTYHVEKIIRDGIQTKTVPFRLGISCKRSTGAAANVSIDFLTIIPRAMLKIKKNTDDADIFYGGAGSNTGGPITVEGNNCASVYQTSLIYNATRVFRDILPTIGDFLMLTPNYPNSFICNPYENGDAHDLVSVGKNMYVSTFFFKPRWSFV